MTFEEIIVTLVGLFAGVAIFLVGVHFLSTNIEQLANTKIRDLFKKTANSRLVNIGIGAATTAIIQSSSATSVMVIGLVNAGVMTLMQATPIIMGANIGTTITGVLVALKNDYFNMVMYLLAFAGVMMGFAKKEKVQIVGKLCSGLGLIFVGLEVMSSEQAFGNPLVEKMFTSIFQAIDFPLLLILVGIIFTALIQSSSAATGVVITMVGAKVLPLDLALFIILGANIGTCVTALLASFGANANSKRVAFIHFTFNFLGTALFAALIWILREPVVNLLNSAVPGEGQMALQMRVSLFHVIFNVTTTLILLPFVKQLVDLSKLVIKDNGPVEQKYTLKFVDDRLLSTPPIALMQVKKEMDYMLDLVQENLTLCFVSVETGSKKQDEKIKSNEKIINFTNNALTEFLIKLSSTSIDQSDEKLIGAYFHVLNDVERIGDHAENFHEIGLEMASKDLAFSELAIAEITSMREKVKEMFAVSKNIFDKANKKKLNTLTSLEDQVDTMKKDLIAVHFARLAEGDCSPSASPYYSSIILGLERVADHLINIGYSIVSPTGSQKRSK